MAEWKPMADLNQPATKQDLATVRLELKQDLADLGGEFKQDLTTALQSQEDRLTEKMRDMQTEILRAFYDWARSIETRTRTLPLMDERLTIIEDRLSRLERERLH